MSSISVLPGPTSQSTTSSSSSSPTSATSASPASTTTHTETSGSSASPSASTTSGATSAQSSSTAPTTPLASTSAVVVTSGGQVITYTSTSFVISTASPTSQNNSSTSSHSFFSNTGAVAGVFTVVGLIAAGFIIALVINAIRRRRAEKFDRDVAEAAAEAAASSRSPFDDYPYANSGGNGGGGGYGYSDNSHGTYQLPPLSPRHDAYGMSEMSQYDPYAAGAASLAASGLGPTRNRLDSEPGAPGIAGVGAGTLAREPSKRAPYHAFAGPGPQPHELQGSNGTFRNRRSNHDVLEAAGLAGAGAAAVAGNNNGAHVTRKPSDTTQHTQVSARSKFGSMSSGGHHPATLQPGYPVESYYPQRSDTLSPDPFAGYPPVTTVPSQPQPLPNPYDGTGPQPSITSHQSDHNEDHGDSSSPTALRSDEQRMSYQDNADYSQGNRVLRVANE